MAATPVEGAVRSADGATTGPGAAAPAIAPLASGRTADESAVDRSFPLQAAAELLSAYVAEAGSLGPLAQAVARRTGLGPIQATRLPDAAALVEATIGAGRR